MANPRILFVDHVGVLGGAELALLDVAAHVSNRCEVLLLEDGPFRNRLEEAGVQVTVLQADSSVQKATRDGGWMQSVQSLPGVWGLVGKLKRRALEFDGLHANSQKAFVISALAAARARRPLIWHLHDILSPEHFSRGRIRLVVMLANRYASRVIAVSEAVAQAFIAAGGREDLVRTVYGCIDSAPFISLSDEERKRRRIVLGWGTQPLVGVFSRIAPWKGQHVLVEALPLLPDVSAVFVGAALFGEESSYAAEVQRRIDELGVRRRVHMLGFRQDIPELLSLVDIVAHTSVAPEPFGRVIVEGMLAGRPVVATRAGGVVEIIDDGETGFLVHPGHAVQLADCIQEILDHPGRAERVARQGLAAARERFSPERHLREMLLHFDEVFG